jgi:hypothetical protein
MMNYKVRQDRLGELFSRENTGNGNAPVTEFEGIGIHRINFHSKAAEVLPGADTYYCDQHKKEFGSNGTYYNDVGTISGDIHIRDALVKENRDFTYHVMKPLDDQPVRRVTFLFHGFNERNWDKYLPWGEVICRGTGSAVIFFPIAFHMQRAPLLWSNPRKMYRLAENRKKRFPNVMSSSLSNVAISMRLHAMPQRFIWSGLQTYYDIISLIDQFKAGKNPIIDSDFTFNIFAYSIGGFLAEILKLANHRGYFDQTRVCLFCGGAVFNRFKPVTKYILDSEANVALYSYLVEHLDRFLKKEGRLRHYIEEEHPEGKVFHALLDFQRMREYRETLFRDASTDFHAITLARDTVVPSFEIMNTLNGAFRDIPIQVEEMDFSYPYTHENPFPANHADQGVVSEAFNKVFGKVNAFLSGAPA